MMFGDDKTELVGSSTTVTKEKSSESDNLYYLDDLDVLSYSAIVTKEAEEEERKRKEEEIQETKREEKNYYHRFIGR
jgi:hypothetical protein